MLRQIANFKLSRATLNSISRQYSSKDGRPSSGLPSPPEGINPEVPIVHFDDPESLPLPTYPYKENEPVEKKKQRLIYQSRKRGMLENDILLSTFVAKYLPEMNEKQLDLYDKLINDVSNDWDLYYWATGNKPIPDEYNHEVMKMFIEHVMNVNKEQRLRQPDLN